MYIPIQFPLKKIKMTDVKETDIFEVDDSSDNPFGDVLGEENRYMEIIKKAEEKHGLNVHMALEMVFKDTVDPESPPSDEDFVWWVEFENQRMYFDTIGKVENFLLNEAVAKGGGPGVLFTTGDGQMTYDELVEWQQNNRELGD
jgi:hypothetical protein